MNVDTSVANAARIWKLYGTAGAKGDGAAGRPHRLARLLVVPDPVPTVPCDLLEALADRTPPDEPKPQAHAGAGGGNGDGRFDLAGWIVSRNLDVAREGPWKCGGYRWVLGICPWNDQHTDNSAFIVRWPSDVIGAGCKHNSCQGKGWHDLRDAVKPGWRQTREQRASPRADPQKGAAPIPIDKIGLDEIDGEDLLKEAPAAALEYLPVLGKDGYLVVGWSHLLAGYPRCGKTELLLASVHDWLRLGQSVLYFTEEPRSIWRQRLHQRPGPWSGLRLVFGLGGPPLELLERVIVGREQVVVVDTLRNLGLLGADECDNAAIAAAIAPWVSAARRHGKTLIMGHHMRRGAGEHGEGISGGHALFGAVDIALELRRDSRPNRRLVKGYARLIQPEDMLYEQGEDGGFVVLGDPASVTLADVRRRIRQVLTSDWLKTAEVHGLLDEPRPSLELVRQGLHAEGAEGAIERDPPLEQGAARGGRGHGWRLRS